MFHETRTFCSQCSHAQFNSKIQLSKHICDHHRRVTSIVVHDVAHALASREATDKYPCPKGDRTIASISTLRRHIAQNCQGSTPPQVHPEARPASAEAGADADQETGTTPLNVEEPPTLDHIGFTYENTWQVAICKLCHFVVDKAVVVEHLKGVHRLVVPNANAVLLVLRMYRLGPHLAVIWNDTVERQLDEFDDEDLSLNRPLDRVPRSLRIFHP
ncbi:hypothetical protein V1517DRAFT_339407 [Lipomyces orientalis]|uniref:Uncharacterized protein n=1 Tax=Lipomyces orientalis TaxID=1233043 RepID=A0ACC3TKU2_9ASCO